MCANKYKNVHRLPHVLCAGIKAPSPANRSPGGVLPGSATEDKDQSKHTLDNQTPEPSKNQLNQVATPKTSNSTCSLGPLRDITVSALSETPVGRTMKGRKKFIHPRPQLAGRISTTEITNFDPATFPTQKMEVFCYEVLYHKYTRAKKKKYFDGILLLRTGKKTVSPNFWNISIVILESSRRIFSCANHLLVL